MSVGTAIRNPRTFVSGKWSTFKTVLFDPERFYDELSASDRLWTEMAVVLIVGLAGSAGGFFVASEILSNLRTGSAVTGGSGEYGVSSNVGLQIWGHAAQSLVGAFLLWLGLATAAYVVSWVYSARGSYFNFVKASAWAMIPMLVGNAIKSIGLVAASWEAWESGTIEVTEGELVQSAEQVVAFLYGQVMDEPVALAAFVVGGLFFVWTGYVYSYGVAKVRAMDHGDALKAVAVPTVAYVGYVVYKAVSLAGVL